MSEFTDLPIENINQLVNEDIASGLCETEIYISPIHQIEDIPKPLPMTDPAFTLENAVVVSEDITFTADGGFIKIDIQTETGEVKDELGGNKGNKKAKQMFDFYLSGTNTRNLGFMDIYRNVPLVCVVQEKTGRYRIIGSKKSPAYIETAAATSGKGPDDDNGIQYTISSATGRVAPVYEGNLTLKPTV